MNRNFDSSHWPQATSFTEKVMDVDNKKSFMNIREKCADGGAKFIGSRNVFLDNEVLLRYSVK